jgi:hypothetical protein
VCVCTVLRECACVCAAVCVSVSVSVSVVCVCVCDSHTLVHLLPPQYVSSDERTDSLKKKTKVGGNHRQASC